MTNNTETGWNFDNSYSRLPETFFSKINLNPVSEPKLVVLNQTLATSLGLNPEQLEKQGVEVFAGNKAPEGSLPLAQAYAGHQFAYFTMLGDGRALMIGEQITPQGERFDIQLKGSGRTPYSRGGDGRATLGPMLREHIISEAMHALNIPTTRSLAVVTTGEQVMREEPLLGAILTRVASSHIRVGTFEYAAQFANKEELSALAEYTIMRHYPEIKDAQNPYLALLQEIVKRQASLISKWILVGFIHGVMNTDNMTLSGETIDYGPCAFMDTYDPSTVFSSIDRRGRYAYDNQPKIAAWNLARLAETLVPFIDDNQEKAVEIAQGEIAKFNDLYHKNWIAGMRSKLGLFNEETEDETLFEELLNLMHKNGADYTNTFRALTFNKLEGNLFDNEEFPKWYQKWQDRLSKEQKSKGEVHHLMRNSNPAVIPRNHRVEEALDAAVEKGDLSVMEGLLDALSKPFAHTPDQDEYTSPPPPTSCGYKTFCGT